MHQGLIASKVDRHWEVLGIPRKYKGIIKIPRRRHALHGEGFQRDAELTQHIDVLKSFGMFGVSDHNLLFTKSEADVEAVLSSFELPHAPTPCLQPVPGCTAPAVDVDLMVRV